MFLALAIVTLGGCLAIMVACYDDAPKLKTGIKTKAKDGGK